MPHPCSATVDLSALKHNFAVVKSLAPNSKIMAVLKANAYGHGLISVAHALEEADGLALARLHEAITLREAGITQRLLLMGNYLNAQHFDICAKHNIDIAVHSLAMAEQLSETQGKQQLNIWLKIDIGMHRLGLQSHEIAKALELVKNSTAVKNIFIMGHLSNADSLNPDTTKQQLTLFNNSTKDLAYPKSLANSAATIQFSECHFDWVRPGIMLYGCAPSNEISEQCQQLKNVMTLKATIIALRDISIGEGVGYNLSWQATRPSKIATLAIGYGDGYPRHAKPGTPVLINGQRAPLVGRVSMDLINVDVTDIQGDTELDTEAVVWGEDLPINEIAEWADTISYDLLTGIAARVPRLYVD